MLGEFNQSKKKCCSNISFSNKTQTGKYISVVFSFIAVKKQNFSFSSQSSTFEEYFLLFQLFSAVPVVNENSLFIL